MSAEQDAERESTATLAPLAPVQVSFLVDGAETVWTPVSVDLLEQLSGTFRATVHLSADLDGLSRDDLPGLLGASVSITLQRQSAEAPLSRSFSGVVVSSRDSNGSVGGLDEADRVSLFVEVVPALAALDRGQRTRRFFDLTVPEIARTVLAEGEKLLDRPAAELRLSRPEAAPGEDIEQVEADDRPQRSARAKDAFLARESCVQYQESDWRFVRRILAEEGLSYFFSTSHEEHRERLVIVERNDQFSVLPESVTLRPPGHGVHTEESIHAASLISQTAAEEIHLRGFDFTRPLLPLKAIRGSDRQFGIRDEEVSPTVTLVGHRLGAYTRDDLGTQSRLAHELALRDRRRLNGQGDVLAFSAGVRFFFDTGEVDPVAGEYLLTEVRHFAVNADAVDFEARNETAAGYHNAFRAIPAETSFRPDRLPRSHATEDWAEVVAVAADDPIHADVHGRVRLRFQDDREQSQPSAWVPVLQRWAGDGFGLQIIPRAGMWARVTYLQGDPDRPVVVDCLPAADTFLPAQLPEQKTRLTLRTRSLRSGAEGDVHANELAFDDDAEKEEVFEKAGRDRREHVLHDHRAKIDGDQSREVGHSQTVEIKGSREQRLKANDRQDLRSSRKTVVQGNDVEHCLQESKERVGKKATLEARALRTTDVVGKTTGQFDGGREVVVDKENDSLDVAGTRKEVAHEDWLLTQQKARVGMTGESVTIETEADTQLFNGKGEIHLTKDMLGATFKSLTLTCGAAAVKLEDERLSLSAPTVKVRGKMAAFQADPVGAKTTGTNITASAAMVNVLAGPMVSLKMTSGGGSAFVAQKDKVEAVKVQADALEVKLEKAVVSLTVTLRTASGAKLPNTSYRAFLPTGEIVSGSTNGQGELVQELPEGLETFVVAFKEDPDDVAPVLLEVGVPSGKKEDDVFVHLRNQGFGAHSHSSAELLADFQMQSEGLKPSGVLDQDTQDAADTFLSGSSEDGAGS